MAREQERIYVYAGHFCPPTYRDLRVVQFVAAVCPWVTILCRSGVKPGDAWFSDEECVDLWNYYPLPTNVEVTTWDKFMSRGLDASRVTYVDVHVAKPQESSYMYLSPDKKQSTVFLEQSLSKRTSASARDAAQSLALSRLRRLVSPLVLSRLLEHVLQIPNLYIIVGPPKAGKTTVLDLVAGECEGRITYIDTDEFNRQLRPAIEAAFPGQDLFELALRMDPAFRKVVARPWFELLVQALKAVRPGTNVFVEVPYGMREEVQIYRMLGGKILCIGCGDKLMHAARFCGDQGQRFLDVIPDAQQTAEIAHRAGLKLFYIDTDRPFSELVAEVRSISQRLLVA